MVQRNKNHKTCKNSIPYVRHSQPWLGRATWGGVLRKEAWSGGLASTSPSHFRDEWGEASKGQGWGTSSHFLGHSLRNPPPTWGFSTGGGGEPGLQPQESQEVASEAFPPRCTPTFAWCLGHPGPAQRVPQVGGLRTRGCQKLLPEPPPGLEVGRRRA